MKEYFSNEKIFDQPFLESMRMTLEPIDENHAVELCELFSDPLLHTFVPFEPLSLEQQQLRCARWALRKSPDGKELWLNWAGRDRVTKTVMAHFQVGAKDDGTASIGYLVSRGFQNQGFAYEGLQAVLAYLQIKIGIREVKAWSDTRNLASHKLAKKLGMSQVEFIMDADFFKGATSDEFVFSKVFYD